MTASAIDPTAREVDEAAIVEGMRAGEEWAFESVVKTYGGRLFAVARRYVANDADAQDVVQSAYLSAFKSIGQFQGQSQLSTWLHRIVVNAALMRLRRQRRKPEASIEALLPRFQDDGHHVEQFSDWGAADGPLLTREARTAVREAIAQLPEGYRTVLLLRDIEELSTQEVAGMLSLTTTAVKVRLHRARQALATLLAPRFAPERVTARTASHPRRHDAGQTS